MKGKVIALIPEEQRRGLARMVEDLNWSEEQYAGFCQRTCGHPRPRTTQEGNQVYQGMEQMLIRLMRPYWPVFAGLIQRLLPLRAEMNSWEQGFVTDMHRKNARGVFISPQMVKKIREIAHKCGVECGFPNFKTMSAAASRARDDGHYNKEVKIG